MIICLRCWSDTCTLPVSLIVNKNVWLCCEVEEGEGGEKGTKGTKGGEREREFRRARNLFVCRIGFVQMASERVRDEELKIMEKVVARRIAAAECKAGDVSGRYGVSFILHLGNRRGYCAV